MIIREVVVDNRSRVLTDLTGELVAFCSDHGDGLAHAFCPHATAALVLMEVGAGSDLDLVSWLERSLPRRDVYHHRHGSVGHGADHLLPALLGSSVTVPVSQGLPLLGTWQSLVLVDTNQENNRRTVRFSFLAG
jgi:secondary thiamine-phosphate synthase enzyme